MEGHRAVAPGAGHGELSYRAGGRTALPTIGSGHDGKAPMALMFSHR